MNGPQTQFLQQLAPFSTLPEARLQAVAESMDVVYFPLGSKIEIDPESTLKESSALYFVIKGKIAEYDADGRQRALYAHHTFFGESVLLKREPALTYVVKEEAIVYRLTASVFLELIEIPQIANYFSDDITFKLDQFHKNLQIASSSEALMGVVEDAPQHALVQVAAQTSIQACVQQMVAENVDAAVVVFDETGDDRYGIVTSTDLLRKLAIEGNPLTSAVGEIAVRPVITVHQLDYLFNALLKMTRYHINRLVVRNDEGPVGILHQKDLMSLFATQSGLAVFNIQQASTLDELKAVIEQVDELIISLNHRGVKTHYIAKLVTEIHRKVFQKVFESLLPSSELQQGCLIVMGSEGRAEQVMRTDQDNALILPVLNAEAPSLADSVTDFTRRFTASLVELGFPECPGEIMVSNPVWTKPYDAFIAQLKEWMNRGDEQSFMHLSIFFDAEAVLGDASLLRDAKQRLVNWAQDYPQFLRHLAKPVLQFDTPISFFGQLVSEKDSKQPMLDIKKGGIFPIVHGVRCLALEKNIEQTNTHWRIKVLMDQGFFSEAFGHELGETLNFFNTLRLESMIEQKKLGQPMTNKIDLTQLSSIQQDLLKDGLSVVNRFKKMLTYHFKLESLL
ncbi:MAG: putative nucleotidyltransferase substrate binding domain-containing protein [Hydrogenovibrio sp.]|nr:putative nucleotidyltransferase substrate binding domain-containing protein [Hydrogenovibrio sp.]